MPSLASPLLVSTNPSSNTQQKPYCSRKTKIWTQSGLITVGYALMLPSMLGIAVNSMPQYISCITAGTLPRTTEITRLLLATAITAAVWAFNAIRQGFEIFSSTKSIAGQFWVAAGVFSLFTLMGDLPILGTINNSSNVGWSLGGAFVMNIADNAYHIKMWQEFYSRHQGHLCETLCNNKRKILLGATAHAFDDIIAAIILYSIKTEEASLWITAAKILVVFSTIGEWVLSIPEQIFFVSTASHHDAVETIANRDSEEPHDHNSEHSHDHHSGHRHDHHSGHRHDHHSCSFKTVLTLIGAILMNTVRVFNGINSLSNNTKTAINNCTQFSDAENTQWQTFSDNMANHSLSCVVIILASTISIYFNYKQCEHSLEHFEEKEELRL